MVTTVNVGDSRLAYTQTGTGTPVIWLHGSGPGATGMSNFGDLTPDLPGIKAPTLLLWGREDQTVPLTWAPRILNGIPDAELRVLPNCRHWVQYEKALEFDHIVREFLAGGVAAAASGE
jgi:pimeloyl-ACP methyl ester carboxylesterase